MPKRNRKNYSRPRKPFDKVRIDEENVLKEKYGLKNKKEIWKADAAISKIRKIAKQLITADIEEKKAFISRLQKKGFQVESIADTLSLNKEDLLKRRLQTIVHSKGLTNTPKQARQLITHKHVAIGDQIVNIPSYQVELEEESEVSLNIVLKTEKKKTTKGAKISKEIKDAEEEIAEEIAEEFEDNEEEIETIVEKEVKKVKKGKESIEEAEEEIAEEIGEIEIVSEEKEKKIVKGAAK